MKKIGSYTHRGNLLEGTSEKITLFDGKFDTAYVITGFKVLQGSVASSGNGCCGRISTQDVGAIPSSGEAFDFSDNTQVAWAAMDGATNAFTNATSIVDPDNLIVEDLFVSVLSEAATTVNYIIYMDKYAISDWKGALAMVRNSSQDV